MSALQTQYAQCPEFTLKPSDTRYVDDLTDFFEKERASGKSLYYLTLTYNESKDFPLTPEKACRHLDAFRKRLLHEMFGSRYNNPKHLDVEPRIIAFLDTSFSKLKKQKLKKVPKHESRYHHHCVIVADDDCVERLDRLLIKEDRKAFRKNPTLKKLIRSIDFQRVGPTRKDTRTVVNYCSETARKFPHDDMMLQVYPISRSEFRGAA